MDQERGVQPGSSIYHANDGFFYLRYKSSNTTQYFRCTSWREGCPGRGVLRNNNVFQMRSGHGHGPDVTRIEVLRERNDLLDNARTQPLPLQDIFHNMGIPMDQRLFRAGSRARSQALPGVENLSQLRAVLEDPLFSRLMAVDQIENAGYRGSVQAPNGSQVLLFFNKKCRDFLNIATSITLIMTSININNQQYKVITMASTWDRNVIPLAWLLFESGNAETFLAGFSLLRTCLPLHQVTKAVCRKDEVFDIFNGVFRTVKIEPSVFDYIHELKTNIQLVDCVTNLLERPSGVLIAKMCCAVSFLPKDMMQIGINQIINLALAEEELRVPSEQLFNFINREWLNSPTFEFNLCGHFERAHYGIENLRSKLERNLTRCNNLYSITTYIMTSLSRAQQKISTAQCGLSLRSDVPLPINEEQQFWNLMESTGFPLEMKVNNILTYVSAKLLF